MILSGSEARPPAADREDATTVRTRAAWKLSRLLRSAAPMRQGSGTRAARNARFLADTPPEAARAAADCLTLVGATFSLMDLRDGSQSKVEID